MSPAVLDEFYGAIKCVGVSAATGAGIDGLMATARELASDAVRERKEARAKDIEERVEAAVGDLSNLSTTGAPETAASNDA